MLVAARFRLAHSPLVVGSKIATPEAHTGAQYALFQLRAAGSTHVGRLQCGRLPELAVTLALGLLAEGKSTLILAAESLAGTYARLAESLGIDLVPDDPPGGAPRACLGVLGVTADVVPSDFHVVVVAACTKGLVALRNEPPALSYQPNLRTEELQPCSMN